MQISRMCKHYSDWCAEGVFAETWKNWGFIDAYTGGEIQPNAAYIGDYPHQGDLIINKSNWYYKWKYDLNDSFNYFWFCNRYLTTYTATRYNNLFFNCSAYQDFRVSYHADDCSYRSNYTPALSNQLYRTSGVSGTTIVNSDYYSMFFIPLKNNGFIYKREASTPVINSGSIYNGYGYPSQLTTYYKQINPFLWDLFSYRRVAGTTIGNYYISYTTVIGFFNNITNKMNYITLTIPDQACSRSTSGGGSWRNILNPIYCHFDYKDRAVLNFIPYLDETGEYTDVKENICTLIKYPYETGALSNLYIISTSPQKRKCSFEDEEGNDGNGLDGKFFSFNGRNFYGFYNNLAVELPSN